MSNKTVHLPGMPPSLFPMGAHVITPGALRALDFSEVAAAIVCHARGEWGDCCAEDCAANDRAVKEGTRIMSAYKALDGTPFWVITEADRSVTTVLLPDEY